MGPFEESCNRSLQLFFYVLCVPALKLFQAFQAGSHRPICVTAHRSNCMTSLTFLLCSESLSLSQTKLESLYKVSILKSAALNTQLLAAYALALGIPSGFAFGVCLFAGHLSILLFGLFRPRKISLIFSDYPLFKSVT